VSDEQEDDHMVGADVAKFIGDHMEEVAKQESAHGCVYYACPVFPQHHGPRKPGLIDHLEPSSERVWWSDISPAEGPVAMARHYDDDIPCDVAPLNLKGYEEYLNEQLRLLKLMKEQING
jgi:hypothetical protein